MSIIEIARIDAGGRLRALDPAWVELLAEEIAADGLIEPIRVVERGDGHKLIDGARRIAAHLQLGWPEIEAQVEPEAALADDAAVRLGEIKGNMLRGDLTVLDRALYLAAWRDTHELLHPQPKRGRRPAKASPEALEEMSAQCANIFTEAARAALGLSQRTIYLLLKIASIGPELAVRIALHPVADKRGELLHLAEQTSVRQSAIVDLLTAEPTRAASVIDQHKGRAPHWNYAGQGGRYTAGQAAIMRQGLAGVPPAYANPGALDDRGAIADGAAAVTGQLPAPSKVPRPTARPSREEPMPTMAAAGERRGGQPVQLTQHFNGGFDAGVVARRAKREQHRGIRMAESSAMHDTLVPIS